MNFICYAFQLGWENSVLCHCYYQDLLNQIQNPISIWEQEKPTLFQDIYALVMTINYCYQKCNHECHYVRQIKKEAFKSYFQKQRKASTSSHIIVSQNKVNLPLVALSAKTLSSKPFPSPTPRKQLNSLQVDLSFKLTNNSKLTSNEHKKHLKNNLCLYYSIGDYNLDFCSKKQTIVTLKGCSALTTANFLTATSKKLLEKQRVTPRTLYRLRATLNFLVQQ